MLCGQTTFMDEISEKEKPDAYILVCEYQYHGDSEIFIRHLMVSFDAVEIYNAKESFEKESEPLKTSHYYVIPIHI